MAKDQNQAQEANLNDEEKQQQQHQGTSKKKMKHNAYCNGDNNHNAAWSFGLDPQRLKRFKKDHDNNNDCGGNCGGNCVDSGCF